MTVRKQRRLKSAPVLRGSNAIQARVPFRRISVELPEPVWARLKNVGLKQQTALGNLIIKACIAAYGDAPESEIIALYNEMAGIAQVEQTPDPTAKPQTARDELRPKPVVNPFEVYTATVMATQSAEPPAPLPASNKRLPVTKAHKANAKKTKQIPADAPESAWEEVKCSQDTVDLTRRMFEV